MLPCGSVSYYACGFSTRIRILCLYYWSGGHGDGDHWGCSSGGCGCCSVWHCSGDHVQGFGARISTSGTGALALGATNFEAGAVWLAVMVINLGVVGSRRCGLRHGCKCGHRYGHGHLIMIRLYNVFLSCFDQFDQMSVYCSDLPLALLLLKFANPHGPVTCDCHGAVPLTIKKTHRCPA